ncbi:unnamed protein product [Peronospora belbahrii]|uniref:Uncharacterized protein n=1 Tax=Peronospora belbahrii TaxID=622444 RepID=A0ABN8CMQ1_9STRA|nr:unnamed protein product [Peronospora belbahrii]
MLTLMKIWGQHYSGVEKQHRLVVSHDRQLLGGSGAPSSMPHPEFRFPHQTLGKLARRLQQSIVQSDEIFLRDAINFLAEHSNEFDGTHPWYASFPRMTCYDGCVIITEAQKGGEGIDVGVFIEFTAMEKLKKMFSEVSNLYEKPMSGDDEVQD